MPPRQEAAQRSMSEERGRRDDAPRLTSASVFSQAAEAANQEEMDKWAEMMDMGIAQYMHVYPERFHRRVRRGIPQCYRWQVWKSKVGVLTNDPLLREYRELCDVPNASTKQIEVDICRTLPDTFSRADWQQALLRVLNAYAAHNPLVGYCQGMNFVAALLLLVSDFREEESFVVLCRLMDSEDYGLSGFYQDRLPLLWRYLQACDKLLANRVPDVRDHFIRESVQPAVYLHQWYLTLFINCFPLSMVVIIWDAIIFEGLPVILRIAVSILKVLQESLLNMHFEEIIRYFKEMKVSDDMGALNAAKIAQLLMKHSEHVSIPPQTMRYLWETDESEELWEVGDFTTMSPDLQPAGSESAAGSMHLGTWLHSVRCWLGGGRRSPSLYGSRSTSSPQHLSSATSAPCSAESIRTDGAAAAVVSSPDVAGKSFADVTAADGVWRVWEFL